MGQQPAAPPPAPGQPSRGERSWGREGYSAWAQRKGSHQRPLAVGLGSQAKPFTFPSASFFLCLMAGAVIESTRHGSGPAAGVSLLLCAPVLQSPSAECDLWSLCPLRVLFGSQDLCLSCELENSVLILRVLGLKGERSCRGRGQSTEGRVDVWTLHSMPVPRRQCGVPGCRLP